MMQSEIQIIPFDGADRSSHCGYVRFVSRGSWSLRASKASFTPLAPYYQFMSGQMSIWLSGSLKQPFASAINAADHSFQTGNDNVFVYAHSEQTRAIGQAQLHIGNC